MRRALSTVVLVAVGAAAVDSQGQQAPQRDLPSPVVMMVGSASISGVVNDDAAPPKSVRRVLVTLTDQSNTAGRTAITDDAGRFAFRGVPSGRYLLQASKPAYLPTAFGSTAPMRPGSIPTGVAVVVGDGQQIADLQLRLTRGAVITGVVRDPDGQPVRGVSVRVAYSFRAPLTGERTLAFASASGGTTDSRGVYRLYGLPPGDYVAAATLSAPIAALIAGADVRDMELTTEADVLRARQSARGVGAPGNPQSTGRASGEARRPTYGYATVFYPGTTALASAVPIALGAGEERSGIDFQIQLTPRAHLTGVVTGLDGQPAGGVSVRMSETTPYAVGPFLSWVTATTDSTGRFMLRGATRGTYVIEARHAAAQGTGPQAWARTTVTIGSTDAVQNISLQPTHAVSGRIALHTALDAAPAAASQASAPPPPDYQAIALSLMDDNGLTSRAVAGPDGRFTIRGVIPGDALRLRVAIAAQAPGRGPWFVKSATVGALDALDGRITIDGNRTDLVVTLTSRPTLLSGTIRDAASRPANEYYLIAFPVDRREWFWGTRRIQQARPATDGSYTFDYLPEGDYLLGAVTDIEENQRFEPDFLDLLSRAAVKVTLRDGERTVQHIQVK